MGTLKQSLNRINYHLFFALLLMALLPTIYTTVRINFLGNLPSDWGFNIASQLAWVNLLYEIVQEALILPLFFLIGLSLTNKQDLTNKVKVGLLITFSIYLLLSVFMMMFTRPLINLMAQDNALVDATVNYIRLEVIANLLITVVKFLTITLIMMDKKKILYIILLTQMILSIILDTFLVSSLDFSLNIGVNGVAFTNIIVNFILLILVILLMKKELGINILDFKTKLSFTWVKEWFYVGKFSGVESFVRNLFFMVFIIRMINVISEQGTYWVANNFIWGWLLLPIMSLGDLIKRDFAENKNEIQSKAKGYFTITTIIILLWLVTLPLWQTFLGKVMNVGDVEKVFNLVLISLGFYVIFAYNNVIDSIFYGIGKTSYMLIQSLVTNIVVYGIAFILFILDVYQPTLTSIAILFGIGMVFDSVLTYILYRILLKKESI